MAERLIEENPDSIATATGVQNPIGDDRFAALFTDPDFEVDEASEEFQLLHPVLTHREKRRVKKKEQEQEKILMNLTQEEMEVRGGRGKESSGG